MEEEKRIAPRVLFDSAIRYRQKGFQSYSDTVGRDISNSGIGFLSNEFIPKNSKLVFELHPPWRVEPIQAVAEVMWVSSQPYSESFKIGAKFLDSIPS